MTPDTSDFRRFRQLRQGRDRRIAQAETRLDADRLVYPMFVVNGRNQRLPIASMPGISRLSVDEAQREVDAALAAGVKRFLLFGLPDEKFPDGRRAWAADEAVQRTAKALKREHASEVTVITDVCLCEYTDHGHCGVLHPDPDVAVDNDATLPLLARVAASHAEAGADIVAPSAMMDGQVLAIRAQLDALGFGSTPILAYSAKYASAYYGPFREAADSAPAFGDRRGYQVQSAQREEAMAEIAADIDEGAAAVMVKPALAYLDVVREAKSRFPDTPLYAYNVSGEYAMLCAAADRGWIDRRTAALELLIGIRRAGADYVITYFALEAARWLEDSPSGIL